jgi:cation diffusion facilitator CzcD-associated flavoprotein CzcO
MDLDQPATEADVCVLGAGPHGLAATLHLLHADPDCRVAVVDPAGAWLDTWRRQFDCAEIASLRSPVVHHPAPGAMALRNHVAEFGLPCSGLPYDLPLTDSFQSFCDHLVDEAELDAPIPGRAVSVDRDGDGVRVDLGAGVINAEHLVVATNPHARVIPDWTWSLMGSSPGVLAYGADVDLGAVDVSGQEVAVVGGGLTAAHLACGAVSGGADVHLITRRPIEYRSFDTDPGWLGPKFLREFDKEPDPVHRLDQAREARGGGTIPPWMGDRLSELVEQGRLNIHDGAGVRAAGVADDRRCNLALGDHTTLNPDRVWLATGTKPDIGALRCIEHLVADLPVLEGYPVTGADLRLDPHPIYVMGRLATLTLGPAAGNLWGAQRAAERITEAVVGVRL